MKIIKQLKLKIKLRKCDNFPYHCENGRVKEN